MTEFEIPIGGVTGPTGPTGVPGDPAGPTGATGVTGLQGIVGPTGAVGPIGIQGASGPVIVGVTGVIGVTGITGLDGAVGETGPIGVTGPVGQTGPQGTGGAVGVTGDIGPDGLQGGVGQTGPVGAAGGQGAQGVAGPAAGLTPLFCSVKKTVQQIIAGPFGIGAKLSWDDEDYDFGGFHSNFSNNERLIVPAGEGGLYILILNLDWDGAIIPGPQTMLSKITKNGSTTAFGGAQNIYPAQPNTDLRTSLMVHDIAVPGDYYEAYANHIKLDPIFPAIAIASRFQIVKISN